MGGAQRYPSSMSCAEHDGYLFAYTHTTNELTAASRRSAGIARPGMDPRVARACASRGWYGAAPLVRAADRAVLGASFAIRGAT